MTSLEGLWRAKAPANANVGKSSRSLPSGSGGVPSRETRGSKMHRVIPLLCDLHDPGRGRPLDGGYATRSTMGEQLVRVGQFRGPGTALTWRQEDRLINYKCAYPNPRGGLRSWIESGRLVMVSCALAGAVSAMRPEANAESTKCRVNLPTGLAKQWSSQICSRHSNFRYAICEI